MSLNTRITIMFLFTIWWLLKFFTIRMFELGWIEDYEVVEKVSNPNIVLLAFAAALEPVGIIRAIAIFYLLIMMVRESFNDFRRK